MNLSDLCPAGAEKYAEFEKYKDTFLTFERIQSMAMMYAKHREFLEHLQACELCKEDGGEDGLV